MSSTFPLMMLRGLKRSGNHAIINWLLPQGRFLFFNDIVPIEPILLGTGALPPPCHYKEWLSKKISFKQKLTGRLRRTTILVSVEDHELTLMPFDPVPAGTRNIILLRDPANFFASRIRKGFKINHPAYPRTNGSDMKRVVHLWKAYARECLNETAHLENKVVVYFPRWFGDQLYRESISHSLGLDFNDAGIGIVSGHGGGSSFDEMQYKATGTNMKVLDRFRQIDGVEKELLDELLSDPELIHYASRMEGVMGGSRI